MESKTGESIQLLLVGGEISGYQLFFYQLMMINQVNLKLGYNHKVDRGWWILNINAAYYMLTSSINL